MKTSAIQKLRHKLAADAPVYGLWVTLESASITEMAVAAGLDWVVIDAEHGHLDWKDIVEHLRATVRSDTVALVRVAELNGGLRERYIAALDRWFDVYRAWLPRMRAFYEAKFPRDPTESESVYRLSIRAKALDTLRGMLPAATTSNVGMYGTGQAYEQLLLRMRAHPLREVRNYADLMLVELRKVIPAFLKRVDVPERGGVWSAYLEDTRRDTRDVARRLLDGLRADRKAHVRDRRRRALGGSTDHGAR